MAGDMTLAMNVKFHPECFVCVGCNEQLLQNFFISKNQPFCGTCNSSVSEQTSAIVCGECGLTLKPGMKYITKPDGGLQCTDCEMQSLPKCGNGKLGCGEAIMGGRSVTLAMNSKFHPECFRCVGCESPLLDDYFIIKDRPYCNQCNETLDEEVIVCGDCGQTLGAGARYITKADGAIQCSECGVKSLPKCGGGGQFGCGKPIQGGSKMRAAMGAKFHAECFMCSDCNSSITAKFFAVKACLYCEGCYTVWEQKNAVVCAGCGEEIKTTYSVALDKNWHAECFKCRQCHVVLDGPFMVKDDQPFCSQCES